MKTNMNDAARLLKAAQAQFERTGLPLDAWTGYQLARASGLAVPEWVLRYFDGCAAGLTALGRTDLPKGKSGSTRPALLMKALGFHTRGGPSKMTQARTARRDAQIVTWIEASIDLHRRFDGNDFDPPDLSYDPNAKIIGAVLRRVANHFHLSVARVRAIWEASRRPRPRS